LRLAKLLRRQPVASAAVAAAVLALLGGAATTAWQAHVARQAQALAEGRLQEVRRITHELVFNFGDSVEYLPGGMQVKAELYRQTLAALERLRPTLGDDPAVLADVAQVQVRLAEAHTEGYGGSLNQPDAGRTHAEAAVALADQVWLARRHDAEFAAYAARALSVLASVEREAGNHPASLDLMRRAMARAEEALALPQLDTGPAGRLPPATGHDRGHCPLQRQPAAGPHPL
jgi:hypothetical protein